MSRIRWALSAGFVALAGAVATAGGWAVITVKQLPDYAVVGTPIRLEFAVRQHGHYLGRGFDVSVSATLGKEVIRAAVQPLEQPGYFRADLMLPRAGGWRLNLTSGLFDNAEVSMPAYVNGLAPAEVMLADRGHRLFAAKGCVTCHRHDSSGPSRSIEAGPALTGKHYPLEMFAAFVAQPPACVGNKACMPALELGTDEVRALNAFLNQGPTIKVVARR